MLKLRRAQDLLSQKRQQSMGLEEVLGEAVQLYLDRNDPLEKAIRLRIKGKLPLSREGGILNESGMLTESGNNILNSQSQLGPGPVLKEGASNKFKQARQPVSAQVRHRLWLKNEGRCGHIDLKGRRCNQSRFLHIHHQKPVSEGGGNELSNLSLLCSGHHRAEHIQEHQISQTQVRSSEPQSVLKTFPNRENLILRILKSHFENFILN